MEVKIKEHVPQTEDLQLIADHEANFLEERAESNSGVRKSSRPRKQSKRVLDSVDCNDIELLGVPVKKKHRRDLKLKTGQKKDILPNGRPFKCSLCESPYINNSPAKAKIKRELQPIVKEKFGQLLQLCVKCAIAVNHTENKGPTPEQRAEFEEEGRQFAQHVVEYLNDSAAARLYCSFYQTTKCGCIQSYITGTPAGRKRKTSLSGGDCASSDTAEPKLEDGAVSVDDKVEQAQRARYLLGLLKESMAKKQIPNAKKSNEKLQQSTDDTASTMKESDRFILENRVKLKELGICERGCQKVLCYSNNFLHKKSVGSQPRLQRTRGRAALGRLHELQVLHTMKCCEKYCVRLAERNQQKMEVWRQRAQQGQKEMWKVLEEMLTATESGKTNCFKFISMVTGCCLTTVQKVYADVLLSKGAAGCVSRREHGMRFHWKRQKELGKRGHTVTTALPGQPQGTDPRTIGQVPLGSDTGLVPTLITNQAMMPQTASEVAVEPKPQGQQLEPMMSYGVGSSQTQPSSQLCGENFEERGDKEHFKEKVLKLLDNMKDPRDMQEILAKLERELLIKQEKRNASQGLASPASVHVSGTSVAAASSLSSASTPLSVMLSSPYTPSCSSNASSEMMPHSAQDQHFASIHTPKQGRPFVHIKVQPAAPDLNTPAPQTPQLSSRKQRVSSSDRNTFYHTLDASNSVRDTAPSAVDIYITKTEALSSQHIVSQPLDLSNLTAHPGTHGLNAAPAGSLPVGSISSTVSPFVMEPHVSSMTGTSLDLPSQQVGLFQVMDHTGAENSHLTTQASQILSVYPQPATPLQIQPFPLLAGNNAQHIQFQLVSPLVLGQSDLMIPLNQAGTMSFILPKQSTSDIHSNETFSLSLPLSYNSSIGNKDSIVSQVPTISQSFQNNPVSSQTLLTSIDISGSKFIPGFSSPTQCNLTFSRDSCNVSTSKQDQSVTSQSLAAHGMSAQMQSITFEQATGAADNAPSQHHTRQALKPQCSYSSTNTPSITVMNLQDIQSTDTLHHVTNIDHYYPSSLLGQASGNIVVGTPSSYCSGSFVFDALADSPVKDSITLSSPSLQVAPIVTSSLLCEMLMRSMAPSTSSISSTHMQDFVPALSTSTTACRSPTHFHGFQVVSSAKSSLLISALKSSPVSSSSYCQSMNFNTHTTPSTMSNQPMVMTGKVEQTSLPVATVHSSSLSHSQMAMSRLNRQREPPQVGIVHPHISGVKGGTGHASVPTNTCSNHTFNHNSAQTSSVSSSSMTHSHLLGESLLPSSSIVAIDSTSLQMPASAPDITSDHPAAAYSQQHLLLPLLLNPQKAASLTDQHVINPAQLASQFNLTALLGSPVMNTSSASESIYQIQSSVTQKQTNTSDSNVNLQSSAPQGSQHGNRCNVLPHHIQMADQSSVPIGGQNIILGSTNGQQPTDGTQFFQSVSASNGGHLQLIPVIFSGAGGSSSAQNIFSQNGQLLVNMNSSPQNVNRDNSILLNMSPNSSQSMHRLHVVGSGQTTSLPSPSPNTQQNNHQTQEVNASSKEEVHSLQFSVLPQPSGHEIQNTTCNNTESQLPTYSLSGPAVSVGELVHAYKRHKGESFSGSHLSSANTSIQILGKDTINSQPSPVLRRDSSSGHSVFSSSSSYTFATTSSSEETPRKAAEVVGTRSANFSKSSSTGRKMSSNLSQTEDAGSRNQAEGKHHVSLIQVPHSSAESHMQHPQLPCQVLNMVSTQEEQPSIDNVLSSDLSANIIVSPSPFQSIGPGQQLHSLNIAGSNQIFLPIQSVPFNKQVGAGQTVSNQTHLQLGQQLNDLHTIFVPTLDSSTANNLSPLVSVVEFSRSMNTSGTDTSAQASIGSTGLQHTSSAVSTSKHRPIRPKLLPVPAPAPKISLMLVPDKSGGATYHLTQLDPSVLSFQHTSDQKEKTFPQLQIVAQEPQNSSVLPGTPQQSPNTHFSQGTPQQHQNIIVVPMTSQHSQNTIYFPVTSQQSLNTLFAPEACKQQQNSPHEPQNAVTVTESTHKQRPTVNTTIMSQLQLEQQQNKPAQILVLSEPHPRETTTTSDKYTSSKQQKQTYPSQQVNNFNIQALPVTDHRCKLLSQETGILSQQFTMQPNQTQMTLVSYETPEMSFLQSGDLKGSPLHTGHFQIVPSNNSKEFQIAFSQDRPVFIDALQSDSIPAETVHTFEVSNLQSSACEASMGQCSSIDRNASRSQATASQMSSLHNDIRRSNTQTASQLDGKHIEMVTQQHSRAKAPIGQYQLSVGSSSGSPTVQTTEPALKETHFPSMKGHDTQLDTTPTTTFVMQSKQAPVSYSAQQMANKDVGKVSQNATQASRNSPSAMSLSGQACGTSQGVAVYASLPSNIPVSNVCTTKQSTAVDAKNILSNNDVKSNSDVKPVMEPVQYLQCKEVIDLTNDSPPLSPSSQLLFRSKLSGLYPPQTQVSLSDDELFSLLHYEGQRSSHQSTPVIPLQLQRLFQQNLQTETQHVPHKLHPTKQDLEDVYKTLSEQENMVLMASGSSPVTGHHEIQFESMTFSPSDNLVYCQASLPSKAPTRHTEDQQRCVATEADEPNKSQNYVRAVHLNQHLQQQPVAPARLQGVELIPAPSNYNLNKLTLVTEDGVALSQATYRPSSNNLNSKLPSLSVVGIPVTNKPLMELSAQGQSRCSSATALFSEVPAAAPSDQRSSSVTSANQMTPTLTKHTFHVATSSPTVQPTHLTTTLPSISSVRTSTGRKILHPLTSSSVAFVRTTNTPTDAVGPPNITIMSSAQASSSPLLRFHHDNSSVAVSTAVINQTATTASSYSLPTVTKAQSSGLLKLTNSTSSAFVPFRIQSSQDARDSTLLLYPNSGGRDQIVGHSARRLSLEQAPHPNASKEVHAPETFPPSLASKPTDSQIKPAEPPPPSKPRSRKRQSTVMDLLRNKEKLQAAASVRSTNNTPGPVTLMISGAAGSSNLLVGDSSAGQPRVDPSALNITVKNIQLLAKLPSNTDKTSASSSMPPSNQRSGFTILQPNILHSSFSRSSSAASEATAVLKEVTTVSLSAMPSTSTLVDSHTSATNTASMAPTIYFPVQSVSARDSPFLANLSQTKLLPGPQDAFNQQVTLANQPFTSTRLSSCGNQEIEIFMSGLGQPSTSDPCRNISTGQISDLRHKLPQEILKSEPGVHLLLIDQPQEARSSYKVKPTTRDLVVQKPESVLGDSPYGKVCKFKTSKSSSSDDWNQEVPSLKLQLLEDVHKKQLIESTGTTKKFLLLGDKLPGSEASIKQQLNPSLRPSLQLDHNAGQVSAEQKRLSLKSPQLLQLMKNKPQFSPSVVDQSISNDKHHHLKLPTTSAGMLVSDDNAAYSCRPSSTVVEENYHISNKISQQRDQNPALKMYPTSADAQLRGIKSGIVGERDKDTAFEAGSDTRKSLLPSQNPLLANILFTSVSGGALNHLHSLSASKSTLYSDTETKALFERRSSSSIEDRPHVNESITLGHHQASSKQLEDQLFGIRTDQLLKRSYEELLKSSPDYRSGPNKAPFKTASDCKSELRNAPPAYSQPPRYELATKDMTRVSKVIEDIYKFPDEADESSPPPAFAGWKSQVEPQKFTFVPSGSSNRKSFDSAHESSTNNLPSATESAQHSSYSKSNIKPMPSAAQCTSAVQQGTKVYNLSESCPTWRNPKKLRPKKEFDKLSSKFGSKKVQFSDVITSKSTSEYGQSITVSSPIDAVPSEVPSNYPLDAERSKSQEAAGVKHQHNFTPYLHGQHQNLIEDNQDSESECIRPLCPAEQFQVEPREYKFSKAEGATVHIIEARDKASELAYIQREEDKISSPDFEAEDRHGRESHRIHIYQHLPKASHRVPATAFVDYEHESKRRGDDDTGLGQTLRHADGSQYPFQSAFTQGNMDKLSLLLRDKPEAHRLHDNQNDLRSPNQNMFMEALRGVSKCDDMAQGKTEGSIRDLGQRKQLAHDESYQPSAGVHHMAERKHFTAAKKELPSLANTAAGNSDRDSSFDQQSSFNILSSQGYSKLSRQRLSRAQSDQLWTDNSSPAAAKNAHFASQGPPTSDTSCSSAHFQDSLQPTRCDSVPASNASSSDNADQQFSDSPLIRQTILENHFQLARQMKIERVQILTDSRSEDFEMRKPESPPTFILYPERKLDGISNIHRGTESQIDKELEYRTLSDPDSVMTSPTFLTSLDGRPDVLLSSIESYSVLRNQIKGLKGVNHYLKQEVAKKEKEQQRQRQLSSSDRQKAILTEADKAEKMYYMSPCSSSQAYMVDADSVIPPRKRHSSSTAVLGMFNCSPLPGSEQNRPDEGFLNKPSQPSSGIQQILESDSSFLDGHLRSNASGFLYSRNMNNAVDYLPPENYIKDTRDPLVSSSMGGHSRPSSHLELGIPPYESTRNRYTASELKPMSSRGVFDGEGFVPLQEHTRHRNLSSSLGQRTLFEDPPPYDITQRHRNPSSSSLKSSFQDSELLNFDLGARSRNPSSSSWIRYIDYTNDSNFTAVRSRNPSGSSNRRSRPGSSSSDRELLGNSDELPLFPDFARTRSRNSSGESIEPTVELFLDPQQFIQYTYQTSDAHIKRTKH